MAEPKTDQEPSIEEILESIRQIISDDSAPAPAAAAPAAPAPATPQPAPVTLAPQPAPPADDFPAVPASAMDDADDEDILDLTDKAVPARAPVIDLQDHEEPPAPAYTPPKQQAPVQDSGAGLMSDITADVSAHAMARLLAGNVAVERDLPGRVGNVTLEDMTRELQRPLLKTWLDQNLPGIIEKMVAKEIEKISRLAMKQ